MFYYKINFQKNKFRSIEPDKGRLRQTAMLSI